MHGHITAKQLKVEVFPKDVLTFRPPTYPENLLYELLYNWYLLQALNFHYFCIAQNNIYQINILAVSPLVGVLECSNSNTLKQGCKVKFLALQIKAVYSSRPTSVLIAPRILFTITVRIWQTYSKTLHITPWSRYRP